MTFIMVEHLRLKDAIIIKNKGLGEVQSFFNFTYM